MMVQMDMIQIMVIQIFPVRLSLAVEELSVAQVLQTGTDIS